jgi:hypothetical protein
MGRSLLAIKSLWVLAAIAILALVVGCTSTPTPSVSATTQTPTPATSAAGTTTPAETQPPSASATPTATAQPSPTPTSTPSATGSLTPTPTPAALLPQIYISKPWYNVPIPPGDITVSVEVDNFNLVNKIGQANVAGEGHIVYYLDATPPAVPGKPATLQGAVESADTSFTWNNISAGSHTFSVQLVNNDGTSLSPPAIMTEPVPLATSTPTPTASPTPTP